MTPPTRLADTVERALIEVNDEAHREFGPDETEWTPGQVREYLIRLDAARFDPAVVA